MHLTKITRQGSIITLVAISFSIVAAADAFAAGRTSGGAGHAGGANRGGSFLNSVPIFPSAPSIQPTFNPSYRYTVPATPEKPVSPASPGSVFGNG